MSLFIAQACDEYDMAVKRYERSRATEAARTAYADVATAKAVIQGEVAMGLKAMRGEFDNVAPAEGIVVVAYFNGWLALRGGWS